MPELLTVIERRRTLRDHDRLAAACRRYELACLEKELAKSALVTLLKELEAQPEEAK